MPAIIKDLSVTQGASSVTYNHSYIFLISTVAALGGLLFGFDTAIISGTIAFIQPYFQLDDVALGWAVSSILIGCAIGAAVAGKLSDVLGRKKVLLLCAILFAVTGVVTGFSSSLLIFIAFQMLGGLAVGAAAMVAPMYIAETAPAHLRGRLVSVYQLAIVSGILLTYLSNYLLADSGKDAWRWMFASQTVPSLLFMICLFFVPETPRWLVKNHQLDAAKKILQKVGGDEHTEEELAAIDKSFEEHQQVNWRNLLLPQYRNVLLIGIIIAIFQQITGINAILYYAPEIFKQTGVNTSDALLQTIGIGVIMFLFTFVAIWLVDKASRKILLLSGCLVMAFALIGVAACFYFSFFDYYLVLICMMLYIVGFSASLGAVTWVILSEIFPNSIRAMALSFSTFILWMADFAVSFLFPVSNKRLGGTATLLFFAALCFIYFVYIKLKVPETKNKTLEELETMLAPSIH
ncbi:MAG: sugar porter family MFS transporter [Chitinophagaceae bacterium]|nr:sugar porter family MFS transporter [Chitinophagaceae bacterium]